jgi:uncharacterized membrane-anchored protein
VLLGLFGLAVGAAVWTRTQHRALYWTVIILSSTAGTTMSDFVTRSLGLGYGWGTLLIVATLAAVFGAWRWVTPRQTIEGPMDRRAETLYWMAILVSSTLGTAFGDFIADGLSLGFGGGTAVLVGVLAVVAAVAMFTRASRVACYWLGIVVTHPLGATMGDYMTKEEGFDLGNVKATLILAGVFGVIVAVRAVTAAREERAVASVEGDGARAEAAAAE